MQVMNLLEIRRLNEDKTLNSSPVKNKRVHQKNWLLHFVVVITRDVTLFLFIIKNKDKEKLKTKDRFILLMRK